MPDDLIPQLFEVLEAAYAEWDRLEVCYAFFGFSTVIVLLCGVAVFMAILTGHCQ